MKIHRCRRNGSMQTSMTTLSKNPILPRQLRLPRPARTPGHHNFLWTTAITLFWTRADLRLSVRLLRGSKCSWSYMRTMARELQTAQDLSKGWSYSAVMNIWKRNSPSCRSSRTLPLLRISFKFFFKIQKRSNCSTSNITERIWYFIISILSTWSFDPVYKMNILNVVINHFQLFT